jgi:sarcosine oxidase subunit alpha
LKPLKPKDQLTSGSHLFNTNATRTPENDLGYVTSSCYSPSIKSFIALAFLKNGTERYGEKIEVSNPILKSKVVAEICNPIFVDPNGDRLRE